MSKFIKPALIPTLGHITPGRQCSGPPRGGGVSFSFFWLRAFFCEESQLKNPSLIGSSGVCALACTSACDRVGGWVALGWVWIGGRGWARYYNDDDAAILTPAAGKG